MTPDEQKRMERFHLRALRAEDEAKRLRAALEQIASGHAYERAEGRRDPIQHCTQLIRIAEQALEQK